MHSNSVEEKRIQTRTQGRYLVQVPERAPVLRVLVGFHGYAESAATHLEQMKGIPGASDWLLCSVQSLHLFYNRRRDVVGSWMTKLGREQAIADNAAYVRTVLRRLRHEYGRPQSLVFCGFSQGVAMAYRAAATVGARCHGLMLLAGDVPPEVAENGVSKLPPVLLARGSRDVVYDEGRLNRDLEVLKSGGVRVEVVVFEGKHEWNDEFRRRCGEFLAALP